MACLVYAVQVIGTAALMVCVLALGDRRNSPAPPGLEPVLVGAVVLCIGVSMGSNSGYSLNPARDLGPRLFTYFAGWGGEVFRSDKHSQTPPSLFLLFSQRGMADTE